MELIDELDEEYWSRGDPNETTGYEHFRVMKCEKLEPVGNFSYGVFAEDGMLRKVKLGNGISKRDPLNGICNIQLRLTEDETEIVGVIVEDDCVLLKSALTQPEPVANGDGDENHADVVKTNGEHTADDEDASNEVIVNEENTTVTTDADGTDETRNMNGDEAEHNIENMEANSAVELDTNPDNT